jgi:hypothetical protein
LDEISPFGRLGYFFTEQVTHLSLKKMGLATFRAIFGGQCANFFPQTHPVTLLPVSSSNLFFFFFSTLWLSACPVHRNLSTSKSKYAFTGPTIFWGKTLCKKTTDLRPKQGN